MSRSTAISRERPRQSDDRRANDSSELRRELSALEENHRRLKQAHASCGRNLAKVKAENAALSEGIRQLRELNVAREQRIEELERSSNLFSGNSGMPPSSD